MALRVSTAEEEALVALLNDKCHQMSLGLIPVKKLIVLTLFTTMFIRLQWIF